MDNFNAGKIISSSAGENKGCLRRFLDWRFNNFLKKMGVFVLTLHSNECTRDYITDLAIQLNKGIVHAYSGPDELLNNAYRYPKHTKIVVGRRFKGEAEYGIKIAEQLHALGFTRLYLFSVSSMSEEGVPNYVKVIKTHDLNWLESILME